MRVSFQARLSIGNPQFDDSPLEMKKSYNEGAKGKEVMTF
jgi:hypothetical protein